jgi:hypothetical protein
MAGFMRVIDESGKSAVEILPSTAETTRNGAPRILKPETFDRELAANTAEYLRLVYSQTRVLFLVRYKAANDQLMQTLRETYDLE